MNNYLVDAHVHLQDLSPLHSFVDFISNANYQNIRLFFNCATQPQDWQRMQQQGAHYPGIIGFYGIHPWNVSGVGPESLHDLKTRISNNPVGIGEVGLDACHENLEKQIQLLVQQLTLARNFSKPFVLHCVKAWELLRDVFRQVNLKQIPFILHSFSGSRSDLDFFLKQGAFISFGPRNFSPGKKNMERINAVPLTQILVETDYPYTPPAFSGMTYPDCLTSVYMQLADIKKISLSTLIEQIWANAQLILKAMHEGRTKMDA